MPSFLAFEDVLKLSLGLACLSFFAMGDREGLLIGLILYKLYEANKGEALRQKRPKVPELGNIHFDIGN